LIFFWEISHPFVYYIVEIPCPIFKTGEGSGICRTHFPFPFSTPNSPLPLVKADTRRTVTKVYPIIFPIGIVYKHSPSSLKIQSKWDFFPEKKKKKKKNPALDHSQFFLPEQFLQSIPPGAPRSLHTTGVLTLGKRGCHPAKHWRNYRYPSRKIVWISSNNV